MFKYFFFLFLVVTSLLVNAQVSYQQMRSNMLQNIWTDADFNLYLEPGNAAIVAKPNYSTPAYCLINPGNVFTRPSEVTIKADILSKMTGNHPRLFANQQKFTELKNSTDPYIVAQKNARIAEANKILTTTPYPYSIKRPEDGIFAQIEFTPATRLMELGLAYQLTGDSKYAVRAWQEMEAVANWDDWGCTYNKQFLGTAYVIFGMALGYDWFYSYMSEIQRAKIREAIVSKGLYPGLFYHSIRNGRVAIAESNWNAVCNGSLSMGALAIASEDADIASRMLYFTTGALENVLLIYGPKGDYEEGPGYWAYGTNMLVRCLAAYQSALTVDYGLSNAPGLDKTAAFVPSMTGPKGKFNFGDAGEDSETNIYESAYFWFANRYSNSSFYWARMDNASEQNYLNDAFSILYYKKITTGSLNLPKNYVGTGINNRVGTGTFRNSFTDANASFLGFHVGYQLANHGQYDVGTFVFDALGERWALDVGDGRYDDDNFSNYFGSLRPNFYRARAEGHNTLEINPSSLPGQDNTPQNAPTYTDTITNSTNPHAIANIACAYPGSMISGRRGFRLLNNVAIIQDEAVLNSTSTICWYMHTRANIELKPADKAAVLSIGTKRVYVKLIGNTTGASLEQASAIGTTPNVINMKGMDDVRKLVIRFTGVSTLNYAVAIIPLANAESVPASIPTYTALNSWREATAQIPAQSVSFESANYNIEMLATKQLKASILPLNTTNQFLVWSSSNANIAKVNSNGVVTAASIGTATITATSANGKMATCQVNVGAVLNNLIQNNEFDANKDLWGFNGATNATFNVVTNANLSGVNSAELTFSSASTSSYDLSLYQGTAIENQKKYQIVFIAKADAPRNIIVGIQRKNSPDYKILTSRTFNINEQAAIYSYEFTAAETNPDVRLVFFIGGNASSLKLDAIVFRNVLETPSSINTPIKNTFILYPNPLNDSNLKITLDNSVHLSNVNISIHDCTGKLYYNSSVINKVNSNNSIEINRHLLRNGLNIIKIYNNKTIFGTSKFIVN